MTELAPTRPEDRLATIDAMRGVALFGILVVNMMYFAWPHYAAPAGIVPWSMPIDRIADGLVTFLFRHKFISMFALLFGYGLSAGAHRADGKGLPAARVLARRLAVLAGFGIVHAVFLWAHDILLYFALAGFVFLIFLRCSQITLLRWAAGILAIPVAVGLALAALPVVSAETAGLLGEHVAEERAAYASRYEAAFEVYATGDYAAVTRQRLVDIRGKLLGGYAPARLALIVPMVLIGAWLQRKGFPFEPDGRMFRPGRGPVQETAARSPREPDRVEAAATSSAGGRRWMVAAGVAAVALSVAYALANVWTDPLELSWGLAARTAGTYVAAPVLCLTYVSLIAAALRSPTLRRLSRPVVAAGRLSLSHYLTQSLICTTLFYGYGFGLFGRVGPAAGLALAAGIYAGQVLAGALLLRRARYGPAEYLWRRLTYRRS